MDRKYLKSIVKILFVATIMITLSFSEVTPPAHALAVPGIWSTKAPRTLVWDLFAPNAYVPGVDEGFGAAAVGTTVYVEGGGLFPHTDLAYNTSANTWTPKTPLPFFPDGRGRSEPAGVVAVNGLVYVIGGIQRDCNGCPATPGKSLEVYNASADSWSLKQSIPTPRNWAAVAAFNGKIYVIGGYNGTQFLLGISPLTTFNIVEAYNITADTRSTLAPMPTPREGLLAAAVGGKIYAIGGLSLGRDGSTATNIVEVYDPATNTWSTTGLAPMPTPRGIVMGGVLCGDSIFVIGGENITGVKNTVEAYIPSINVWTAHPGMPTARAEGGAAVVGNTIYVTGGFTVSPAMGDTGVNESYTVTCAEQPVSKSFTLLSPSLPAGQTFVPLNTLLTWNADYVVANIFSTPMTSVVLKDLFAASLAVDTSTITFSAPPGSGAGIPVFGVSRGSSAQWNFTGSIGTLQPGQVATLSAQVHMDLNPAVVQEFTQAGLQVLNSGATLKWIPPGMPMQGSTTLPVSVMAGNTVGAVDEVVTAGGMPAQGVSVSLISDKKTAATATTDDQGFYHFDVVAPGIYTLSTKTTTGKAAATVTVSAGAITTQNLTT